MKAALVTAQGGFEVAECAEPEPGPGEVLLRVSHCGICGSDLHMLEAGVLPPRSIIGHELSARVAALGAEVAGWRESDPVVVLPMDPCMSCDSCKEGNTQTCVDAFMRSYGLGVRPGGFAEYMVVGQNALFRVPEGLDMHCAALTEPLAVAVHGIGLLGRKTDAPILIMGAGPIGMLCAYVLRHQGFGKVYVSEPRAFRADRATRTGATVVDPNRERPDKVIEREHGTQPRWVLDCVGNATTIHEATMMAAVQGQVLALGVPLQDVSISPWTCISKEIRIIFGFEYTRADFQEAVRLLAGGAVDPAVLISDVMPLESIDRALRLLREDGHMKILIDCGGSRP